MEYLTHIDITQLLIILSCLLLCSFFAASETAISSLGSLRAKHLLDNQSRALTQLRLWLDHPSRLLTTILIFSNAVKILAAAVATDFAIRHAGHDTIGIAIGTITFLSMLLIFGEIVPKSLAKTQNDTLAITLLQIVYVFYLVSLPLVWVLSKLADFVVHAVGGTQTESPPITEEELEFLVNVGEKAGVLEETKKDMITSVFEFDETKVREIMTPRPDIDYIRVDGTYEDALRIAIESGMSRIPVCNMEGIDHIIGTLLVKDLLKVARLNNGSKASFNLSSIMRAPFFVPESKLIMEVFKDLKRSKNHIAIVIDEHGGTAGLVTLEDILEEIVGEIQDEYDVEEAEILEIENGIYDIAGSYNIDEFIDFFDLDEKNLPQLRDQDIDTIAGWITALLGELPEVGKTVRIGPLNIEVADVERQRVRRVRVSRIIEQGEKIASE